MEAYQHKYRLAYEVKQGTFTKEDLEKMSDDTGGTDQLVLVSILQLPNGSASYGTFSVDGTNEGKPLPPMRMVKAWSMLTKGLADDPATPEPFRKILSDSFEAFRAEFLKRKGSGKKTEGM